MLNVIMLIIIRMLILILFNPAYISLFDGRSGYHVRQAFKNKCYPIFTQNYDCIMSWGLKLHRMLGMTLTEQSNQCQINVV